MPTFTNNPLKFTQPTGEPPEKGKLTETNTPRKIDSARGLQADRPHPFLQAHGFPGSIDSFNKRVEAAHKGFTNAYGREPSPGLLWDVAKNVKLMDNQIGDLFKVPLDQRQMKAQQFHLESQHNGDGWFVHSDGRAQRTNMMTAFNEKMGFNHPDLHDPKAHVLTFEQQRKQYPMVAMGILPTMLFGKKFWADAAESQRNPAVFQEKLGYLTPQQADQVAAQAQDNQIAQSLQVSEMTHQPQDFQVQGGKVLNPQQQEKAYQAALGKDAKASIGRAFVETHQNAVQNIKSHQEWLLTHDPGGVFTGLNASGVFDRNWMVAFSKWERTPGANFIALKQLAAQNYFPQTPAGVKAMTEADRMKVQMANAAKNYDQKWQIVATPLRFFDKTGSTMGKPIWHFDKFGVPVPDIKNIGKLVGQFNAYETTGTSWLPPVAILQSAFRLFKLGFNEMSGGFNQLTADAAGASALAGRGLPMLFEGKSTKQIAEMFATQVKKNPDWVRVLGMGYLPDHLHGSAAWWDGVGNFLIGTAIGMMMQGPGYWELKPGESITKIRANPWLWFTTRLAHANLKMGDLWEAEKVLGPRAAGDFIRATYKDVQSGKLSHAQFHDLITSYVHDGKLVYNGKQMDGGILPQLWNKKVPKSMARVTLRQVQPMLRKSANEIELRGLTHGSGAGRMAESFLRVTRGMFSVASPEGRTVNIFHEDLPGRIQSFILNKGLMPRDQAKELVNKFVLARASNSVGRMESLLKDVRNAYDLKFPVADRAGHAPDPFERFLETEGLTNFTFPSGARRRGLRLAPEATKGDVSEMAGLASDLAGVSGATSGVVEDIRKEIFMYRRGARLTDSLLNMEDSIVKFFNRIGYYWRGTILATGPGLFYKHLARDSLAAVMGGMKFKNTAEMDRAWQMAGHIIENDPALRRYFAMHRGHITSSDFNYMTGGKWVDSGRGKFNLHDMIQQNPDMKHELGLSAAAHVRRQIDSVAYHAYLHYVDTGDMQPLIDLILHDRGLHHQWNREMKVAKEMKVIKDTQNNDRMVGTPRLVPDSWSEFGKKYTYTKEDVVVLRKMMQNQLKKKLSTEYAKMIVQRYRDIQEAGDKAGVHDLLGTIAQMNLANPGLADKAVAKMLLEHEVNVPVQGGVPLKYNWFDKTTRAIVGKYMTPNRYFRTHMFDSVFKQNYANLIKAGFDPRNAMKTAIDMSSNQTMYHMLDFSNTLQFEQRFRGFLPFFTKHRLFVKWLIARMIQYPLLSVPISEVSKHLDPYGRVNFNFMGQPMEVNLARLFWLSSEDLPATIPGLEFIPGIKNTGLAPEMTRFDSLAAMWIHGVTSHWNYDSVTAHMSPYDVRKLDRAMAIFTVNWRMHHGLNSPVPEREALKYAMMHFGFGNLSFQMAWNNAFLGPATFGSPQISGDVKKKSDEYWKLFNENPAKARAYLDQHPEVGMTFGLSQNFNVYNHTQQFWGMYDKIHTDYKKVEARYTDKALSGQALTAEDFAAMHKAQARYDQGIHNLLVQDAKSWTQAEGGFPAGQMDPSGQTITQYGPWGQMFLHDPMGSAHDLIKMFGMNKIEARRVYGYETQLLQDNIDNWQSILKGVPDAAKVRAAWIDKLNKLEGVYKVVGKPTVYQAYEKQRNVFWSKVTKLRQQASSLSGYEGALKEYQARNMILDNYQHSTITLDGKTVQVPSFTQFSYATKTPSELDVEIFKNIVQFPYSTMTFDQKQLIGMKSSPAVDRGWGVFNLWVADYAQQTGKSMSTGLRDQLAITVNRQYPGFYRDWKFAHLPTAYVLLYEAPKAFQGPYAEQWRQLVTAAADAFKSKKTVEQWGNTAQYYDQWIRSNWPRNFVEEYKAVGGEKFLLSLIKEWG